MTNRQYGARGLHGAIDVNETALRVSAVAGIDVNETAQQLSLQLSGIAAAGAFGLPRLGLSVSLSGFADADGFGSPVLAGGAVTLALSGIGAADGFGSPALAPGAVALQPPGLAAAGAFGAPVLSAGTVALQLSGIVNPDALGAPALSVGAATIAPAGFAGATSFGALTLQARPADLAASGFADPDRFGAARLVPGPITIALSGVADADRFGVPVLQLKKKTGQDGGTKPGGIGAAQKYATRLTMSEAGLIVALEVQSSVAKTVNTRMALYADVGGLPGALLAQSAVKTSVAIGANSYPLQVPQAVPAGAALWAALHSDGNFNWFLSAGPTSRFNADAFADGPRDPFGASTLSNNKAPVFLVFLEAITLPLATSGFADADSFGAATLVPAAPQDLAAMGFADGDGFGAPLLSPVAATLALSGIVDADGFGAPALRSALVVALPSIAGGDAFGAIGLARATAFVAGIDGMTLRNRIDRVRSLSNPLGGLRRLLKNRDNRIRDFENVRRS